MRIILNDYAIYRIILRNHRNNQTMATLRGERIYHIGTADSITSVWTVENWLNDTVANALLSTYIEDNAPLVTEVKTKAMWRRMGFFSNLSEGYKFAGTIVKSQPLTTPFVNILDPLNVELSTEFNGVLVNDYRNGLDHVDAHSDNEKELSNGVVAAITTGASRPIHFHDITTNRIVKTIETNH